MSSTYILGIETSCDETAAGIVDENGRVLANRLITQIDEHKLYGGVVPEIAARAHLDYLDQLIEKAMQDAGICFSDLSAVAATCGPGLIGGVMVGMMSAKAIAASMKIPFIAINHLEAHALTPRMEAQVDFPFLLLLISGMNTQFLAVEGVGKYKILGQTLDDAIGECFDKSGRLMELGYPAGPYIQKYAEMCEDIQAGREKYPLPSPMKGRKNLDFSFSGLKTTVRSHVQDAGERLDKVSLCASLQATMVDIMGERTRRAFEYFQNYYPEGHDFVISGGVAANGPVRSCLNALSDEFEFTFHAPPLHLCGDNGVMIAWAGQEYYKLKRFHTLDVPARARWPLDLLSA